MILKRPSNERGHANFGWLDSYHTFSFGGYHDPAHEGFRSLRVINEDVVAPGGGFDTHPHANMEIITYVVSGELEHRDSLGNGEVIHPGEVQAMTAGTGIEHSEFNPSEQTPVHLLQIWIRPAVRNLKPGYGQRLFKIRENPGVLHLLAAGADEQAAALKINQDARLYAARLLPGQDVTHDLSGRYGWVQIVRGSVTVNGAVFKAGDGAGLRDEAQVAIRAAEDSEFLFFDLA